MIGLSFIFSRLSERRWSDKAWRRGNFKGVNKQTRWTIQLAQVISQLFRIELFVICWLIRVLGLLSWHLTNAIPLLLRSRKPSDNPAIVKLYKWVSSTDVLLYGILECDWTKLAFYKFLPELYFTLEMKSTLKWPSLTCLITLILFVCVREWLGGESSEKVRTIT